MCHYPDIIFLSIIHSMLEQLFVPHYPIQQDFSGIMFKTFPDKAAIFIFTTGEY